MSKWSVVGGLLCVAGFVIFGFQVISSLVGRSDEYDSLCIYDLVDPGKMEWIDGLTWLNLDMAADYIASAPLFILLIIVGGILLIISGFIKH